ncbi:hypothetical protein ACHAWF_003043, partial [Thalassiosira exigua]
MFPFALCCSVAPGAATNRERLIRHSPLPTAATNGKATRVQNVASPVAESDDDELPAERQDACLELRAVRRRRIWLWDADEVAARHCHRRRSRYEGAPPPAHPAPSPSQSQFGFDEHKESQLAVGMKNCSSHKILLLEI